MPTEHISLSYKFAELSDEAKASAVETVAGKLGGEWFGSFDMECVSESIVYAFADALESPGWDKSGEGDFPGIAGVKLDGWDFGRGEGVLFDGSLDRTNAPALPWVESIEGVHLSADRYGTSVGVEQDDDGPREARDAMQEAVQDALDRALSAGRTQYEFFGSEENAQEWIDSNDPDFNEGGSLF